MKIELDKLNESIIVTEIPLEANKMVLVVPEYVKEGVPDTGQGRWVHSAQILLTGTLQAIKTETIENEVPLVDDITGEQMTIEGEPQWTTEEQTVENVIVSQEVNLAVL